MNLTIRRVIPAFLTRNKEVDFGRVENFWFKRLLATGQERLIPLFQNRFLCLCYYFNMNNKIITMLKIIAPILVVLLLAFFFLSPEQPKEEDGTPTDYKNTSYLIDGKEIQLVDGYSEIKITADSAVKIITRYFGNELFTDLDGDGDEDVAFILTQETGGSGVFYYAVSALKTENGYAGSDGYLLGDRIAPQSTTISPNPRHKNVVVFNYADRGLDEPMSAQPSIGKSVFLKVVPETRQWGIVEPDFEGESALLNSIQ